MILDDYLSDDDIKFFDMQKVAQNNHYEIFARGDERYIFIRDKEIKDVYQVLGRYYAKQEPKSS